MRHAMFLGALAAVGGVLAAAPAEACGGFFCSRAPIDQAGERIVFGVSRDSVEAHVQIQYQGSAEQFAWVVPVPVVPVLGVGTAQLFSYLDMVTQPRFQLEWRDTCPSFSFGSMPEASAPPMDAGSPAGGVTVVSREDVGPYDAAILSAGDAVALREWLTTNGYDIPARTAEVLQPYADQRYYFVALKLQQNKGVGDLRPIVLKMATNRPCIPIRLTAIAAQPNMPIIAYVFAEQRAVPLNYRHVLINPTRVDWLRGGANYAQVATAAVDEAGGRAFLTEFAGQSSELVRSFSGFARGYDTQALAGYTHPVDFVLMMMGMQMGLADGSVQGLLRQYVPMPASLVQRVPEAAFYNNIGAYRYEIDTDPGRAPFDAQGFARALEEQVNVPLKNADALLKAYPYLTRLYTTMSAEEMTVDPEFDFNPDAPTVSNVFTAKASFATCDQDWSKRQVRIELPDGRYFFVTAGGGPINEGPNSQQVEQYSTAGGPLVIQDNGPQIMGIIDRIGGGVVGEGCNCMVAQPGSLAVLGLLAGVALSRRRRSR